MDRVGRYQLQGKLGEGGMGVVYKAYDPLLQRVVAVKLIAGNIDADPDLRERFFTEARAAGHLSHRNLVTIHDLGEEQGQPYFAMEFLEGRDLGKRMRSQEPMTLTRKLDIVSQVAEGLRYAHALGITHRDIKPGNIFLTSTGDVKLLDFGLARLHGSELTRSHSVLGTVSYMAPEQIRGEPADPRTDLFSLGVVLYELLSGRRAFEADSFATTLHRILEGAPEPLARLDPCLPPELIHIVDRTLAKAPEDRYQRVDDFLVDLVAFKSTIRGSDPSCLGREASDDRTVAGLLGAGAAPLPAGPGSGMAPGSARSQPSAATPARARVPVLAVASVVLALLVVAAVAWWRSGGPTPGAEPRSATLATTPAPPVAPATPVEDRPRETGTRAEAGRTDKEPEGQAPAGTAGRDRAPARPEGTGAKTSEKKASADDAARESAHASLVELARRKGRAESARAPELAAATFGAAAAAEQAARRQLDGGAYRQAAAGLAEAGRLFEQAEAEARAAEARRAERLREMTDRLDASRQRYQEARRRAIEAGAQASAAALLDEASARAAEGERLSSAGDLENAARAFEESTASLEDAARRAAAAKSAPPDPPPDRAGAEADRRAAERAIADVVSRYASALENRSISRLKRVWPSLGGAQERAIEEEFRYSRSIAVAISEPRIELAGNQATVTCERSYRLETRDGQRLQTDTHTVLSLRRDGEAWVIDNVRHQPRR